MFALSSEKGYMLHIALSKLITYFVKHIHRSHRNPFVSPIRDVLSNICNGNILCGLSS